MGRPSAKISPDIRHQATEFIFALMAAPGDAVLRRKIDVWIAADPAHAQAWRIAEAAWRSTASLPRERYQADTGGGRVLRLTARRARPVLRLIGGIAAAVLLLAAVPDLRDAVLADHATRTAQVRDIALDDGSIVSLAPESAISVDFGKDARLLSLLRGEAFFRVAGDVARPFTVRADELAVTVTGTSFDVNMTGKTFMVSVASGSVRVASGDPNRAHNLTPGQRLSIDRETKETSLTTVSENEVASWRSGQLALRDATMLDAVNAIGRYHRGVIAIRDDALKLRRVTGVFNLNDPRAALRLLAEANGGTVREMTPFLIFVTAN